jgi:ferredoxin
MSAKPKDVKVHGVHVSVDRSRCAGHAVCLIHAPTIFDVDDEGYSVVLDETPADIESAHRAEINCPERAIRVEEDV